MTSPRSGRSLALAAAITAIVGLAGNPDSASASGIPVVDGGHIGFQLAEFGKELERHTSQVAHWNSQIQEWKSKLSQNPLARLQENASLRPKIGSQLQIRTDTEGAEQRCNRYGGGPLGALGNVFQISFDASGNLREEQKKLCALQVALENRKWNENVLLIRMEELHKEKVETAADQRSQGMTEGEANTIFGNMDAAKGEYDASVTKGQLRINTLNNMIASVEHMQSMAAQQLLAGSKPSGFVQSAAMTLAQGAVLEAALSVGNGQCGGRLGEKCANQ